jgi:hypothetical protein
MVRRCCLAWARAMSCPLAFAMDWISCCLTSSAGCASSRRVTCVHFSAWCWVWASCIQCSSCSSCASAPTCTAGSTATTRARTSLKPSAGAAIAPPCSWNMAWPLPCLPWSSPWSQQCKRACTKATGDCQAGAGRCTSPSSWFFVGAPGPSFLALSPWSRSFGPRHASSCGWRRSSPRSA